MANTFSGRELVVRFGQTRSDLASELFPLLYNELRATAARCLKGERSDHTLQPTALLHEAYLRLADESALDYRGRSEFVSLIATQIRKVLVDHARRRRAQKRGGERRKLRLDDIHLANGGGIDLVELDDALRDLAALCPRQCRVVELRFFGGMELEEVAALLGVSRSTVKNDWRAARAWLAHQIER